MEIMETNLIPVKICKGWDIENNFQLCFRSRKLLYVRISLLKAVDGETEDINL